jgi:Family of unknown function (DUF5994)
MPATAGNDQTGQLRARVRFRQPISKSGYLDAAWWPRTRDLRVELPQLLDVLWTAGREMNRISYNPKAWESAPRRLRVDGRTIHLGWFTDADPLMVTLRNAWGSDQIDVMVIPPDADPDTAQEAMMLASSDDNPYTASDILSRAANRSAPEPGFGPHR